MSSLVDLVLLFWFSTISRWIIGKLIFCKYMKNLMLQRNITWGMYAKVPMGVITWLSYFTLHISQKYWLFIHFPSCSHQVNCTHWTKWYFTDFPYLLLANQWRPKYGKDSLGDYGDDTSTYFLKSTFPFGKMCTIDFVTFFPPGHFPALPCASVPG